MARGSRINFDGQHSPSHRSADKTSAWAGEIQQSALMRRCIKFIFLSGQAADSGDRDLMKLCEETGGRAFFTGDSTALEQAFTKLANELRNQYVVT
jgi:hypothetical protein